MVKDKTVYSISSTYTVYGKNSSACNLFDSMGIIEYRITEDFIVMKVKGKAVVKKLFNASLVYVEFGVSPQRPYVLELLRNRRTLATYLTR